MTLATFQSLLYFCSFVSNVQKEDIDKLPAVTLGPHSRLHPFYCRTISTGWFLCSIIVVAIGNLIISIVAVCNCWTTLGLPGLLGSCHLRCAFINDLIKCLQCCPLSVISIKKVESETQMGILTKNENRAQWFEVVSYPPRDGANNLDNCEM